MPEWVTVFGPVNNLDAEPGTQDYSARARPLGRLTWVLVEGWGSKQAYRLIHQKSKSYLWSRDIHWCLAVGLACRDQRWLTGTGSGSALEALCNDALYKSTFTLLYFSLLAETELPSSLPWRVGEAFCTWTVDCFVCLQRIRRQSFLSVVTWMMWRIVRASLLDHRIATHLT